MKRIDTTIGYREEYESGEIRYYPGQSWQGECYKDDEAIKTGEGVAYIREAIFYPGFGKTRKHDYITKDEATGDCTRAEMLETVREYFKGWSEADGAEWAEKFYNHVVECVYYALDWQGFDMLLDEWDWEEDMETYKNGGEL